MRRTLAALAITGTLLIGGAPAFAQYTQPSLTPTVEPSLTTSPSTTVKGSTQSRGGTLGVTGADIAAFAALGVGSVGTGALLVAGSRRRRRSS